MNILLIIAGLALVSGLVLLGIWYFQQRGLGILKSKRIYSDTGTQAGQVLYSKTLPLSGKPDYIIKENNMVYPVEVKTGITPESPYENHTMQLMAYCFLVEENFGVRPTGGYLKYPKKEFKIAYTDEAKESVKNVVEEILRVKVSGEEQHCKHKEHYNNLYGKLEA